MPSVDGMEDIDGVDGTVDIDIGEDKDVVDCILAVWKNVSSFLIPLASSFCFNFSCFCHQIVILEVPVYTDLRLPPAPLCQWRALSINLFPTTSNSLNSSTSHSCISAVTSDIMAASLERIS